MKRSFLLFSLAILFTRCESLGLQPEVWDLEIRDYNKEQIFVLENKDTPSFVYFDINGDLSNNAQLLWTDHEPDSSFTANNKLKLNAGKVNIVGQREDYYSQKMYIKYQPLADSISGNLKIRVKIP